MKLDQPLGLPEGSVRAILALVLTAAAIAATFLDVGGTDFLWPASLSVNAFYFAQKKPAGE